MVREHSLCKSDFDTLLWKEHSVTLTVLLVLLHVQGGKGKVEYQQINFIFIQHNINPKLIFTEFCGRQCR